jgi:hypothetical protein
VDSGPIYCRLTRGHSGGKIPEWTSMSRGHEPSTACRIMSYITYSHYKFIRRCNAKCAHFSSTEIRLPVWARLYLPRVHKLVFFRFLPSQKVRIAANMNDRSFLCLHPPSRIILSLWPTSQVHHQSSLRVIFTRRISGSESPFILPACN